MRNRREIPRGFLYFLDTYFTVKLSEAMRSI